MAEPTGASTGSIHAELADEHVPAVPGDWPSELPVTVTSRDFSGDKQVTVRSAERVIALDIAGSSAATCRRPSPVPTRCRS